MRENSVKGTGSEREIQEKRKSRNMKNMIKREKNAVEGRREVTVAERKGGIQKGEEKEC